MCTWLGWLKGQTHHCCTGINTSSLTRHKYVNTMKKKMKQTKFWKLGEAHIWQNSKIILNCKTHNEMLSLIDLNNPKNNTTQSPIKTLLSVWKQQQPWIFPSENSGHHWVIKDQRLLSPGNSICLCVSVHSMSVCMFAQTSLTVEIKEAYAQVTPGGFCRNKKPYCPSPPGPGTSTDRYLPL